MKKILCIFLSVVICIGISGCSSNNSEEVMRKLNDAGYKIYFNLGFNHDYYNSDDNCYSFYGVKKTCERLMGTNLNVVNYTIVSEDFMFTSYMRDDKLEDFSFSNTSQELNDRYRYDLKNDKEFVSIYSTKPSIEWCDHYIKGESDLEKPLRKSCTDTQKPQYEKVLKDLDNALHTIGISQEELYEFFDWYLIQTVNDVRTKLEKKRSEQVTLTYDEVKERLTNEYTIEMKDGTLFLTLQDTFRKKVISLNDKKTTLSYDDDFYSGPNSKSGLHYMYDFDTKNEFIMNESMSCVYNLVDRSNFENTTCNSAQIHDGESLQSSFKLELKALGVTFDEFLSFLQDYK